ncbi:MAG TPA: hypothetical protein VK745_18310 [Polyangiaceae bacterium]|jgi:hypothetical protein|nr:hypothetical protein [Polyangiaceae bacterium]
MDGLIERLVLRLLRASGERLVGSLIIAAAVVSIGKAIWPTREFYYWVAGVIVCWRFLTGIKLPDAYTLQTLPVEPTAEELEEIAAEKKRRRILRLRQLSDSELDKL